jgi:hypothetical protein
MAGVDGGEDGKVQSEVCEPEEEMVVGLSGRRGIGT